MGMSPFPGEKLSKLNLYRQIHSTYFYTEEDYSLWGLQSDSELRTINKVRTHEKREGGST